jgi:anti-sigma factor (TIGR02949 family)
MNCHQARRFVFLFADNEMEETVLVSFRQHLGGCPHCAREADQAVRRVMVLRRRCYRVRVAAPESLRDRILQLLRG